MKKEIFIKAQKINNEIENLIDIKKELINYSDNKGIKLCLTKILCNETSLESRKISNIYTLDKGLITNITKYIIEKIYMLEKQLKEL